MFKMFFYLTEVIKQNSLNKNMNAEFKVDSSFMRYTIIQATKYKG